jgi:hypothetical protein
MSELEPNTKIPFLGSLIPPEWEEIEKDLPKVDGAAILARKIPGIFLPIHFSGETNQSIAHNVWNSIGYYYRMLGRYLDAFKIYLAEYDEMIKAQSVNGQRIHKVTPLCWAFDMSIVLNRPIIAKRLIMLTLCEDAIEGEGDVSPDKTGVYHRINWGMGMPDAEIKRYSKEIWNLASKNPRESFFPEWILQRLDDKWAIEYPSVSESREYLINSIYCQNFIDKLGEKSGQNLEKFAEYLLSCIPGCRAKSRQRTPSTDYDIVCVLEGNNLDFRSAIDRYFVCECKDWDTPADVTTIMKFWSVLKSIKTNFGIIFSKSGISGTGKFTDAEREQVKIFQADNMVIIVIDLDDLVFITKGGNLISLLREKYEKVRLDLSS